MSTDTSSSDTFAPIALGSGTPQPDALGADPPAAEVPPLSAFLQHLGVTLVHADAERAELAYTPLPDHLNGWSAIHGGVLMSLLDVAMSYPGRLRDPHARGVVTVDMSTQFLRPGRTALRAIGRCAHASTSLVFCHGEIIDAAGRLVARGQGTFKLLHRADILRHGPRAAEAVR